MPFILLIFGMLFLIVAIRGTQSTFFSLLKSEFVGSNSFVVWASALVILGMVAYIRPIKPAAQAMMGLVLLVVVIANKGFFAQFNSALRAPASIDPPATSTAVSPNAGTTTPAPQSNAPLSAGPNPNQSLFPSPSLPQYTTPDPSQLY